MHRRPNILFIFPDQWRGDCLSFFGHPDVETPHIDELCYRGVVFSRIVFANEMHAQRMEPHFRSDYHE